jgi:hypothetical protein
MEDLAGAMKTAAYSLGNKGAELRVEEKTVAITEKIYKHRIGISAGNYNLSNEINSFFGFLESDYPAFNSNLVLQDGKSTPAFSNTTGFFVNYEYLIKKNIHLQAALGAIRQSTTANYDIKRKALLPMINHDAGDLSIRSGIVLAPLRVGASWIFMDRKRIQLRAGTALAFTSIFYTADFDGAYKWIDTTTNSIRNDSIASWLDMSSSTLSLSAELEVLFKLNSKLYIGLDFGFERSKFSSLSGKGNMAALNKALFSSDQQGLPAKQEEGTTYEFVTFKTLDEKEWTTFREKGATINPIAQVTNAGNSSLLISSPKADLNIYYNF